MNKPQSRRSFLVKSAVTTAGIATGMKMFGSPQKASVHAVKDKIRMGFIGIGNRGSQLMNYFMRNEDVEVAALCDVYEPYLNRDLRLVHPSYLATGKVPKMEAKFPKQPKLYSNYRKLLEDKEVDAVCIATPDHWHAIMTIEAIQAGKDVYCEKPLTKTILEGRKMVEAQAASKQVVTVGLQRRACATYQKLAREIPAGKIGKVSMSHSARVNDMWPNGIGKLEPADPPKNFDWDRWLGPRAYRPYQYNIAPYFFRWWDDYSSQMGNWGVHYLDVTRWMMGETAPSAISAVGGKYVLDHDGDIPDTCSVVFEFASGSIANFGIYEGSSGTLVPWGEVEMRGTKGTIQTQQKGYRVTPTHRGQFQDWDPQIEAEEWNLPKPMKGDRSGSGLSTVNLIRDFLDCIKSRNTPLCTLEEGHRSTSFAHLANIALKTRERLEWDSVAERFTNSDAANELLHYEYRKPYKL